MKARIYIEHEFLPWILFLHKQDTLEHLLKGKEEYLCEMYNHISNAFYSLEFYELYMFQISSFKIVFPSKKLEGIMVSTPDTDSVGCAKYLFIVYDKHSLFYFTFDCLAGSNYALFSNNGKEAKRIATLDNDLEQVKLAIRNYIMEDLV